MDAEIAKLETKLTEGPPIEDGYDAGTPYWKDSPRMKSYYRVMLGKGSAYAAECFTGGYIGVGFGINQDLSQQLPEQWRQFNKQFIPIYLASHPDKTKIGAGLVERSGRFRRGSRRVTLFSAPMGPAPTMWAKSSATTIMSPGQPFLIGER